MLQIQQPSHSLCDGISRREWMRIGGIGLGGLSLAKLSQARAAGGLQPGRGPAKSVIVLFITGGVPQHETWDPKPDAPAEVRGAFGSIATRTPGLQVGELMPKLAQLSDKLAVVRSMVTGDNAHSSSGYQMLTGIPHAPLNRENAKPGKPNDWPALGGIISAVCEPRGGIPSAVSLPRRMANNNGQDPWPGTDAGILGRRFDPWLIECDPSEAGFQLPVGQSSDDFSPLRIQARRTLLDQFNRHADSIASSQAVAGLDLYKQQALELIAGGRARLAFDLGQESARVRDNYTRTRWGQSVLLARRLVEAGVSLVQVQWASQFKDKPNSGGWDTHEKHNESIKGWLIPVMDQVCSTLINDLDERGLLQETLVCIVSEFGHTPKFNARAGRDHWGRVFSIALCGAGIRGGVVYGASDKYAAEPKHDPVRPSDYLATVLHCMGFPAETIIHDIEGRPFPLSRGQVIEAVLA